MKPALFKVKSSHKLGNDYDWYANDVIDKLIVISNDRKKTL